MRKRLFENFFTGSARLSVNLAWKANPNRAETMVQTDQDIQQV
jgi:hypothetical protein